MTVRELLSFLNKMVENDKSTLDIRVIKDLETTWEDVIDPELGEVTDTYFQPAEDDNTKINAICL